MNLGQGLTRASTFQGLDLTEAEFRELWNEARERFALRTKYPRKVAEIGPTVSGQEAYAWPEDLLLPLKLSVAGRPWGSSDPTTIEQIRQGELTFCDVGLWFDEADEEGQRTLRLYPTPEGEQTLVLEWVFRPAPASEAADEPTEFPEVFHDGLLYEAAAIAFEGSEDNIEFGNYYAQKAEGRARELMAYDNLRRSGGGVFRVPILGRTAR